jgi:hypothetical protein
MDPADGYFIVRQAVLFRAKSGKINRVKRRSIYNLKWSINTSQGRRTHVFIGDASTVRRQLFVGVQNTEVPGRSTSRVFNLAWTVVLALLGFTAFAFLGDQNTFATGALILALAAVASFASAPPPGHGVLGPPLLSRFAPPALALGIVVYIAWLASLQLHPGARFAWLADGARNGLALGWHVWVTFGFAVPLAGAGFLAIWLSIRRKALGRNYARVLLTSTIHSDNFY